MFINIMIEIVNARHLGSRILRPHVAQVVPPPLMRIVRRKTLVSDNAK